MAGYQTIEFSIEDHVAIIKLNRPDAANGITMAMAKELMKAAITCDEDSSVRAVLITGNGKIFSAGGDLKEFYAFGDSTSAKIKQLMVYLHTSVSRFARMNAPVIIAVNGTAAGAGFSLACAGDIVLAARSASFTMAYTAIGLSPDGGSSYHLPRLIGIRRTQELMLTNRRLSAEEALDWGILTRVVDDEQLYHEALALAKQLAQGPTLAYAQVKKLMLSSSQESLETQMELEARGMGSMSMTEDGKRGIQSFVNKEKPEFSGR